MIEKILNKFKNIILRSKITSNQKDGNYVYTCTSSSFGQNLTTEVYYPYGYAASVPTNALGVTLSISSQPENKITLPYDPLTRFIGLEPGESIMGNQVKKTFIKFNNDGTIIIKTDSVVTIEGDLNVTGNITSSGNISDNDDSMANMRTIYNSHDHNDPQGGVTGTPNQPM